MNGMEIMSPRAKVGAGEPFVGQSCPVGTSPNGNDFRFNSHCFHSGGGVLNEIHMIRQFFLHVIITVLDGGNEGSFPIDGIQVSG